MHVSEQRTAENKLYRVSWINKRTAVEQYEVFVEAPDFEGAIRNTKRAIRQAENGVAETDIEITEVAERQEHE
jgi:hypothetical protein